MKKSIMILTLGTATAFAPAFAQEAPQTERTQSEDRLMTTQDASAAETKKTIDKSALPPEVMNSFEQSEYQNMSIVTVYEVKTANERDATYAAMDNDEVEDRALDSAVYQSEEKVANTNREDATAEMQTPEEREETGQVTVVDDPLPEGTIEQGAEGEITADEKDLYENNKYDQYTEANSDAYAEIAKENSVSEQQTKYELQVKSDEQEMILIYDQQGNLVKADKGAM